MWNLVAMLEIELSKQIAYTNLARSIARILANYYYGAIFAYCFTPLGREKLPIWRAANISLSDTQF
jgi:hypothetical protein